MTAAQFKEMEEVIRAAVRFPNERVELCLQMAEHVEPPTAILQVISIRPASRRWIGPTNSSASSWSRAG
ncbi:hypothetical protein ACUN0C_19730, partial [Faunimonas sp. B44]|uniref:hypothetical protein n=1 Tax=Faunimonas sp. B44 TaxID=3461493 RepID=UPI004044B75C